MTSDGPDGADAVLLGQRAGSGVLATYAYDNLGRRTGIGRGNGTSTSYGYDGVSRLSSLSHDLAGTSSDVTVTLAYNPASEIVSRTLSNDAYAWTGHGNGTLSYTSNGLNRLTAAGSVTLSYDAKGNLISDGANGYGYSSENRLNAITLGGTTYPLGNDALGRFRQGGGLTLNYDGDTLVAEQSGSTSPSKYVPGPGLDEPLVSIAGGTGTHSWFHADERGSVIAGSNASGAAAAVNSYDEYGKVGGSASYRFHYTGQVDLINNVDLFRNRLYLPTLGRFAQTDPIGFQGGMNLYAYVGNNPVNRVDPSGTCDFTVSGDTAWSLTHLFDGPCNRGDEFDSKVRIGGDQGRAKERSDGGEKPQREQAPPKPRYCSSIGYKVGDFIDSTLGGGAQNLGTGLVIGGAAVGAATAITGVGAGAGAAIAGGGGVIYAGGSALSAIGNGIKFLSGQSGGISMKALFSLPLTRLGPGSQIIVDKVVSNLLDKGIPDPCK